MAKRGRPVGSRSRLNPTQVLANRLRVLRDLWFAQGPRKVMPKPIKLRLYHLAIELEAQLQQQARDAEREIEAGLLRGKRAADNKLRAMGWSQKKISAHFIKLRAIANKRRKRMTTKIPKIEEIPDADTMWKIVDRLEPRTTSRKKDERQDSRRDSDERKAAYQEYQNRIQNAWREWDDER